MANTVLSVGQCGYDDSRIAQVVRKALGMYVERAHSAEEARRLIGEKSYALVLVNRVFDAGGSGIDLIGELKQSGVTVPLMLVSDYADAQAKAIANGAAPGFGKSAIGSPDVVRTLKSAVPAAAEPEASQTSQT
jgi:DNA-binding NtrC family response regulator